MITDIKTIFLDIDGCIIYHHGDMDTQNKKPIILPGVKDKINLWEKAGHKIIITTSRRESLRTQTESMLQSLGIYYDMIVMGLPRGARIVINDTKADSDIITAVGMCVKRNEGLVNVNI